MNKALESQRRKKSKKTRRKGVKNEALNQVRNKGSRQRWRFLGFELHANRSETKIENKDGGGETLRQTKISFHVKTEGRVDQLRRGRKPPFNSPSK